MAKKNALERAEERINQLQAANAAEIQQHAARIEAARARITEARTRMEQAEAAGDLVAYKAAKLEQIDAETEIEFSTNRTNRLQSSALVDDAEAKRVVQEILDEEKTAQADDEDAIIECVARLENIGTRNKRRHEKLYKVLQAWHTTICKDATDAQVDNNRRAWAFVERAINDNNYKLMAGEPIGQARQLL